MVSPKKLGVDPFPEPVSHFGALWQHFGFCSLCGWCYRQWVNAPSAPLLISFFNIKLATLHWEHLFSNIANIFETITWVQTDEQMNEQKNGRDSRAAWGAVAAKKRSFWTWRIFCVRVHEISLAGAIKVKDGPLVHIMITGWPKVVNIRSEGLQNENVYT